MPIKNSVKENEEYINQDIDWDVDLDTQTPWDPNYESHQPEEMGPFFEKPFVKDNTDEYESMQEKIDDILYDPLTEQARVVNSRIPKNCKK